MLRANRDVHRHAKILIEDGTVPHKIITSKVDFLGRLVSTKDQLGLVVVAERLAEVQMKSKSTRTHESQDLKLGHLIEVSDSKPMAQMAVI